jgi:rhodanese-related sulfurtransferase
MTSGYAGDVSPKEAFEALDRDSNAVLIDVRTSAEWSFVGMPDLKSIGRQPLQVEWQTYPSMAQNSSFAEEVARAGGAKGKPMYFLCRSGGRSKAAAIAMTAKGFGPCFNIAGGFEGNRDASNHRGTIEGWKESGLPWRQD